MITDILLILLNTIFDALVYWLPTYSLWPQSFLDAINYAITSLGLINFILPIDSLIIGITVLTHFLFYFYTVKLLIGGINWLRGSGELKV